MCKQFKMHIGIQAWIFSIFIPLYTGNLLGAQKPDVAKVNRIMEDMTSRSAKIDVNHISMWVLPNGLFANDPATGHSGLEYPKESGNYAVYMAGFSIGAMVNDRACAATNYYEAHCEPGIIREDGSSYGKEDPAFKVYKITAEDTLVPGPDYLNWPAGQGAPLDRAGHPLLIGDQTLWCTFVDPLFLKAEVHLTVFGWEHLDDMVFMFWEIINKGTDTWEETFIGVGGDSDMGEATDDYIGSDSTLALTYNYNGDDHDPYYGTEIPAIGLTLIQPPVVPSTGDSVLVFGRLLPGYALLSARSPYIHKSDAAWGIFVDHPVELYMRMQGLSLQNEPLIDPISGRITQWVFSGDPVTGQGWVEYWPPHDTRYYLSSGPFTMAPGDTQLVGIAVVFGVGGDHLESVEMMKKNVKSARFLYEIGFLSDYSVPCPEIAHAELNREIVLSWDNQVEDFRSNSLSPSMKEEGYRFEGYNVYEGDTETGPWHRIAVFDKVNGIQRIRDQKYLEEYDIISDYWSAEGRDSGLRQFLIIDHDWQGNELVNGRTYYYAVTAYIVYPDAVGIPIVRESEIHPILAVPHMPEMRVTLGTKTSEKIEVIPHAGESARLGNISGVAEVVNPHEITGHDYRVDFLFADSGPDSGYAVAWNLVNVNLNQMVLANQINLSGDENYPIVDGLICRVIVPEPGAYGIDTGAGLYGAYGSPYGGFSVEGSRYITGVNSIGNSFFGGLMLGEEFFGSTCKPGQIADVRIEFVNDQSRWTNCSIFERPDYAFKGIGTFPGSAWDISDTLNPRQLNICFVEQVDSNAPDNHWDPIAADIGDDLGGREYLFIMASDYVEDPSVLYNDENGGPAADVMFGLWAYGREGHTSNEEFTLTIHAIKTVQPGNYLTFTTSGLEPVESIETAKTRLDRIQVVPNPYFGYNPAETDPREYFVTFFNLPEGECTIRIFTLSGQLIKVIRHINGTVFDRWDLCNSANPRVRVASGMYIATIEIPEVGTKILKLAVIIPGGQY
jgi:hypothetical protein